MRISELARQLKPYMVAVAREISGAPASGGVSGGGGSLTSHVLAGTGGLSGTYHSVSGLTAGQVLKATSPTDAAFGQLQHSQLGGVTADQHHAQSHVLATTSGLGADHTVSGLTAGQVLRASAASAALFTKLDYADLVYAGGGANLDVFGLSASNTPARLTPSSDVSAGASAILRSNAGALTVATLTAGTQVRTPLIDTASGDLTISPAADIILTPGSGAWVELTDGKSLRTASFTSGFAGAGLRLDQGVSTAARTTLELDDLWVRGRMHVYELLIHQIRATNGSLLVANTGKITTRSLYSGTEGVAGSQYTLNTDPEHGFAVGDLIRAQRWTGSGTYQSDLQVVGVFSATNFRAQLISGNAPQAAYEYVRLGNVSDANRRGGVYLTADDSGAPYLDVFDGIDAFSDWNTAGVIKARLGRLDGIFSGTNEYGLYIGNGTTDASAFLRLGTSTNRINNLPMEWWTGGSKFLSVDPTNGMDLVAGTAWDDQRSYSIVSGASTIGGLYGYVDTTNTIGVRALQTGTKSSFLYVQAEGTNTYPGRVYISAGNTSGAAAIIDIDAGPSGTYVNIAASIIQTTGQHRATPGTNAAPGIASYADTNTGVYWPNADEWAVSIGGTQRLLMTATGATVTGAAAVTGAITATGSGSFATTVSTATASLNAGVGRSANGAAELNLVGDTIYTAYGLRLYRANTGQNANSVVGHRGTGGLFLIAEDAGYLELRTNNTKRAQILATGEAEFEYGVYVNGENGAISGYVGLTDGVQGVSTGTGTIKMNGTTARNSTGWWKIYLPDGSTAYVPYFATVTG